MTGTSRKQWGRFPRFIEYANERDAFIRKTTASMQRAWSLSVPTIARPTRAPGVEFMGGAPGGSLWTKEESWEKLREDQPTFRKFLDRLIAAQEKPASISPDLMKPLTEHCAHIRLESRWDGSPEQVRNDRAQRYELGRPDLLRVLAARGHPVEREASPEVTRRAVTPLPRYNEFMKPSCPLDGLYWELREFLRVGQLDRLKQCPVCQRYFLQMTARAQQYCDTPCRLKDNRLKDTIMWQQRNAEYQRRHRRNKNIQDLNKIQATEARLREQRKKQGKGEKDLALGEVLCEMKMSQRRWTSLHRWEVKQYEKSRATDLTS